MAKPRVKPQPGPRNKIRIYPNRESVIEQSSWGVGWEIGGTIDAYVGQSSECFGQPL